MEIPGVTWLTEKGQEVEDDVVVLPCSPNIYAILKTMFHKSFVANTLRYPTEKKISEIGVLF